MHEHSLQMANYGAGPQRGPMGQSMLGGLNSVGQRGMPANTGLSQAGLQRQPGAGVNMAALGGTPGTCALYEYHCDDSDVIFPNIVPIALCYSCDLYFLLSGRSSLHAS